MKIANFAKKWFVRWYVMWRMKRTEKQRLKAQRVAHREMVAADRLRLRHLFAAAIGGAVFLSAMSSLPAFADQNFTDFGFPATDASTNRTMPARLADIRNVKDFGAVGNGVTSDTAAIQAAINASGNHFPGTIFFPPGSYVISLVSFLNPGFEGSLRLQGCGNASKIIGNTSDFLIKIGTGVSGPGSVSSVSVVIDDLWITNGSTNAASGGVLFAGVQGGLISNCRLQGQTAWSCWDQTFGGMALNTQFVGVDRTNGSIGAMIGQHTSIYSCDFSAFGEGVRAYGLEIGLYNNRMEVNTYGMMLGKDSTGATQQIGGYNISGGSLESNLTGIYVLSAGWGTISNVDIHGSSTGGQQMVDGLHIQGAVGLICTGVVVGGSNGGSNPSYTGYAIDCVGANTTVFVQCSGTNSGGTNWNLGTNAASLTCIRCNNPSLRTALTQSTSKSTGVTSTDNNPIGTITMNNAALGPGEAASFIFTNTYFSTNTTVYPSIVSGATAGAYLLTCDAVGAIGTAGAGGCRFSLRNLGTVSLSEAVVFNYTATRDVF